MPRNGSGNYTLPVTGNPVVTGTVIDATWANTSFNDFATQFNNVITRDGLLGFTAPVLAVDGSAVAPGYAFAGQASTGIYRTSTFLGISYAGVQKAVIDGTGLTVAGNVVGVDGTFSGAVAALAITLGGVGVTAFPAGTIMLFLSAAAPTGWTRLTGASDRALRITDGAVGTGGTQFFTTVFTASRTASGTVDGTALSVAQMPAHAHTSPVTSEMAAGSNSGASRTAGPGLSSVPTSSMGSGSTHNHTFTSGAMNFDVAYFDALRAQKA